MGGGGWSTLEPELSWFRLSSSCALVVWAPCQSSSSGRMLRALSWVMGILASWAYWGSLTNSHSDPSKSQYRHMNQCGPTSPNPSLKEGGWEKGDKFYSETSRWTEWRILHVCIRLLPNEWMKEYIIKIQKSILLLFVIFVTLSVPPEPDCYNVYLHYIQSLLSYTQDLSKVGFNFEFNAIANRYQVYRDKGVNTRQRDILLLDL